MLHASFSLPGFSRLHPSSTRCAFLSSALSKHERLTLSRHHSQRFVPKAQGQTGGPVRKDKQGAAPDNKGEHRKERNEGTFQDRGSPARRWSDARGDSRGVQRQSMGFRLKGNEGIRDGEDRGKSWRDGPNHSPRNGYSQPDRHDSISAHKGWGRDGVGVGFDARRMERPASHSHDQDAHSMGDTSRQGMRDGRKGGGWHHERGRGRDTSSQDMNRKEGGDWRLGREGDASRSNNSSGDGAVYKASNSGRPTPFKTQAPRADDRPPAHRQQRSTVTGQIPARSSSIKPSLDLPVVREGEGDKGTFFAEGEDARWNRLGLGAEVVAALKALGAHRPSHIQVAALQAWNNSDTQHLVIADQAGSGKTLAYLLPLIQAIRSEDARAGAPCTVPRSPRGVVITPTAELAAQVYRVAKAVSRAGAHVRVAAATGGQADERGRARSLRTQREALEQGVDLLVATPGRFAELVRQGAVDLAAARGVVLDEVDVLMGDSAAFRDQVLPLRDQAPSSARFILVTATLPSHTATALAADLPGLSMARGPGLHRTAPGLVEELVDCSGGDEVSLESGVARKLQALHASLRHHRAARTVVFCNKIEACRAVENSLLRKNVGSRNGEGDSEGQEQLEVLAYHEAIRDDLRQAAMNAFLSPPGKEDAALATWTQANSHSMGRHAVNRLDADTVGAQSDAVHGSSSNKNTKAPRTRMVLVATDRMSRGIDCMYCEHVVLFDFPRDPSEYVRRVGRTARGAGGRGVVTSIVLGREVALARDIMNRNERGMPVHKIPEL